MNPNELPELTLQAYSDIDRISKTGRPLTLAYRSESLQLSFNNEYAKDRSLGSPSGGLSFQGGGSSELTVTFLLYEGVYRDVFKFTAGLNSIQGQLSQLYACCYSIDGGSHQPRFLKLQWDKTTPLPYGRKQFLGVLRSIRLKAESVSSDGKASTMAVECQFEECISRKQRLKAAKLNSPDLTHVRQVVAGDRLDLKTWSIYGDSALTAQIARNNDLDSPRLLRPGMTIAFPPYQSEEGAA